MLETINKISGLKKFLIDVFFLMIVTIGAKGLRYISAVIIARNLSIEDYGYYAYFIQMAGYISVIIEVGLPTSIIVLSLRKGIDLEKILHISLIFLAISAIFSYLFIKLYLEPRAGISLFDFGDIEIQMLLIYSYLIFFGSLLMACLRAKEKNQEYSLLLFFLGLLTFLLILIILFFDKLTLINSIFSLISASAIWVLALIYFNKNLFKKFEIPKLNHVSVVFNFGLKNYVTRLLSSGVQILPFIFIALSEYKNALGYFGAAAIIVSLVRLIGQSISMLLTARLSKLADKNSYMFTTLLSGGLGLVLFISYPLIYFSLEHIISFIYGQRYLPAVYIVNFSLIAVSFEVITNVIIRPFITQNISRHYLQWIVYLIILIIMIASYMLSKWNDISSFLIVIGKSMALSNFIGLLAAITFLIILWKKTSINVGDK